MSASNSGYSTEPSLAERLDSWKEIAVYLKRDVRTVQRWEKTEGLPVHRHVHEKLGTVYAYKSEIDLWRQQRDFADEQECEAEHADAADSNHRSDAPGVPRPNSTTRIWVALTVAVVLLLAGLGVYRWRTGTTRLSTTRGLATIAVLPFENLSGDPSQEYFSDGITEELIVQLGRLRARDLQAIAVGSAMSYRNTRKPVASIARELAAGYVVQGSVRRSGEHVRVSAHLIRVSDDAHLWDESYDRDLRDVLALQTEVAEAIASAISVNLAPRRAAPARRVNPEAYEAYLKGRFFWAKRMPEELNRAVAQFKEAIRIDPNYAPAYVGLADCYALLGSAEMGALPPRVAMPIAEEAVNKALQLDDQLGEAHASLAHIKLVYEWDWAGAESEFRRAIDLNPAYATAHQWYALYLNAAGHTGDALAQLEEARKLDPLSPAVRTALAEAYYFARQYDSAAMESRKALELDPNFVLGLLNLGRALAMQGKYDAAIEAFAKGRTLSGNGPAMSMFLADAYAMKGDRKHAAAMLDYLLKLRDSGPQAVYVPALYVAAVYIALGDRNRAVEFLDKAREERCEYLIYLDREPMADSLRSDVRFERILHEDGLHPGRSVGPQ